MKLFRTLFLAILLFTFVAGVNAQTENTTQTGNETETVINTQPDYCIHISGNSGFVLDSKRDRRFGLGGTIAFMLKDKWINKNEQGFFTISVKGFNNPYGDGKLIASILNDKGDAFNYIQLLAGYRYTLDSMANGVYVEPRIGYTKLAGSSAFTIAPALGYTYNNFDFALFCDMGFASKRLANLKDGFVTLGVSVGYNIPF